MKTIILLLLSNLLLFAGVEEAQSFYESKEFLKAKEEAKASTQEYGNPKLHLVWAQSAYALGDIEEAMSAYERVLLLDENSLEVSLALATIYKDTKRVELAQEISASLQNYALTPEQKTLLSLPKEPSMSSFAAKVAIETGHDTNINVNPGSAALDDYYGTTGNEKEIATLFGRFMATLSYVNELEEKGGWSLRTTLNTYYQNNSDAHFYDLLLGSVEVGSSYTSENYTLHLPLNYERINYLEKDLFQQFQFNPRVNISLSNDFILNINAKYSTREYLSVEDKNRNDTLVSGGFGFYYLLEKDFLYFNTKYENFQAEQKSLKYIDKDMLTASIGINYNLTSWLVSKLDYRVRVGSYKDDIGTFVVADSSKRSDLFQQVELRFSHYFMENMELYISDRYAINSSNYVPSEYSKNVVMLGLGINY